MEFGTLKQLFGDDRGSTAPLFAAAAAIMVAGAGVAIDYGSIVNTTTGNQAALDAAVTSAVAQATTKSDAAKLIAMYYAKNGGLGKTQNVKFSKSSSSTDVSAESVYPQKNSFGGLLNLPETNISVSSSAMALPRLTSMLIEPETASGSWSKTMLFTTSRRQPVPTRPWARSPTRLA